MKHMVLNGDTFWHYYNQEREGDSWDYKQHLALASKPDFAQLAKDILAFANYGGGYLLLGVMDKTRSLMGVEKEIDPSELGDLIEKRLGFHLDVQLLYFDHGTGEQRIRLGLMRIPPGDTVLMSMRDLCDSGSNPIVREADIYFRRNTRSVRARTGDIEKILKRIITGQRDGDVAIDHEPSPLRRLQYEKFDFYRVLQDSYDPNAEELGKKLEEVWRFCSKRSKADFARLVQIPPPEMDAYFKGRKELDLSRLVAITKMFALPTAYFFRPTYDMRFAFWSEDLVKYAILSRVSPKSAIRYIDNDGSFYAGVLCELAMGISQLHDLLYSVRDEGPSKIYLHHSNDPWFLVEPISEEFRSELGRQYYKLLEQYPLKEDRSLMPHEHIMRKWFFVNDEYISRLIVEGVERITVKSKHDYTVTLRFIRDLKSRKVRSRGYDESNLRMTK